MLKVETANLVYKLNFLKIKLSRKYSITVPNHILLLNVKYILESGDLCCSLYGRYFFRGPRLESRALHQGEELSHYLVWSNFSQFGQTCTLFSLAKYCTELYRFEHENC